MKAYTWHRGEVVEGLELAEHERFGPALLLGERGRGRYEAVVALDRKAPPAVAEMSATRRVLECDAREIILPSRDGRPAKSFTVLAAPRDGVNAVLARVCTQWKYTKSTYGRYHIITGEVRELARGWGAHGDAGRVGSWLDVLLYMPFGSEVEIQPEGGYKTSIYRLWVDASGGIHTATLDERELMQAMD